MSVLLDTIVEEVQEFWLAREAFYDTDDAIRYANAIVAMSTTDTDGPTTGDEDLDNALVVVHEFQHQTNSRRLVAENFELDDKEEWAQNLVALIEAQPGLKAALLVMKDWFNDIAWEDDQPELDCGVVVYSLQYRAERMMDLVAAHGYPNDFAERLQKVDEDLAAILTEWQATFTK